MAVRNAARYDSRRVLVLKFMAVNAKTEAFQKESKKRKEATICLRRFIITQYP
jgi:hypothetical protein